MTNNIRDLEMQYEIAVSRFELDTSDVNFAFLRDAKDKLAAASPKAAKEFASIEARMGMQGQRAREQQNRINEMIPSIQLVKVITANKRRPYCLGVSYHGRQFYLSAVVDVRTQRIVSQGHYLEAKLPDGVSVTWVDHCGSERREELEVSLLSDQ